MLELVQVQLLIEFDAIAGERLTVKSMVAVPGDKMAPETAIKPVVDPIVNALARLV